tara:strand:- start:39998 stop:41314 length:1317 start_codon:yes stop_codon:yes gene_type:complete
MAFSLISGGTPTPFPGLFSWAFGLSVDTEPNWTVIPAKDVKDTNSLGIEFQRVFEPSDVTLGTADWLLNEYSRHQAFNAADINGNSSRILVLATDNFWHVYDINTDGNNDVTTVTYAHPVVTGGLVLAEGVWHPTDQDLFTYVGKDAATFVMYQWNCATQQQTVVYDWTTQMRARHPAWAAAGGMWNTDEGMYSDDGRYAAFKVHAPYDENDVPYLGMVCVDLQLNTILGSIDGGAEPNYITMSPSGAYVVPGWYYSGGPNNDGGAWRYDKDFTNPVRVSVTGGEHADCCVGADGDDYYVSWEYGPTSLIPGYTSQSTMFATNMRTQVVNTLYSPYAVTVTDAMHYSGRCIDLPGYVVTSHYGADNRDGIYLLNIHDGTIRKIGHAHVISDPGYYHQPHACVSPSGKHILATTDADQTSANPYSIMFHIPINSIPPAI